MKVRRDARLELTGTNLLINSVEQEDAGDYDCEVSHLGYLLVNTSNVEQEDVVYYDCEYSHLRYLLRTEQNSKMLEAMIVRLVTEDTCSSIVSKRRILETMIVR
jgi:hypothetical protein